MRSKAGSNAGESTDRESFKIEPFDVMDEDPLTCRQIAAGFLASEDHPQECDLLADARPDDDDEMTATEFELCRWSLLQGIKWGIRLQRRAAESRERRSSRPDTTFSYFEQFLIMGLLALGFAMIIAIFPEAAEMADHARDTIQRMMEVATR